MVVNFTQEQLVLFIVVYLMFWFIFSLYYVPYMNVLFHEMKLMPFQVKWIKLCFRKISRKWAELVKHSSIFSESVIVERDNKDILSSAVNLKFWPTFESFDKRLSLFFVKNSKK